MPTGTELSRAGFEGPVLNPEDDRYGFTAIAQGLARSIRALDENISTVIGIEGKWGAGKSTLVQFLTRELQCPPSPQMEIVTFSPWLHSPDESPVMALLVSIAARLTRLDTSVHAQAGQLSPLATNLMNYAQQTSRGLVPLIRFGSKFFPWMELVADGMDAVAETELGKREKTAAELRAEIEHQIASLGVNFIVVIDDLDRLEPAQAVEILRMVRSVADFSCIRYVMCYDRNVLAHAVESALGVQDGRLYLQKIIPLSFSLPRPESFGLRREFRQGALALWREVNAVEPDENFLQTLDHYTECYGEALSTPREVKQALNAVRFRYPGLRDYVYFPDLCLIQLLTTVNPALSNWVEHYLTEWSVVTTRDAHVSDEERMELTENLIKALSQFGAIQARSVWELHDWLPGIEGFDEKTISLFVPVSGNAQERASSQRRLSSPVYWRYYFSFSAPQNVMSDADIQDILALASSDYDALERRLSDSVTANGISSRTWFEHILTRLTPAVTANAHSCAQRNLLKFLFRCSDRIIPFYRERDMFFRRESLGIDTLASQLIEQLKQRQPVMAMSYVSRLVRDAEAFAWTTAYLSHLGRTADGDPISRSELANLILMIRVRLAEDSVRQKLAEIPHLSSFIHAWHMISYSDQEKEDVRAWITGEHLDDSAFLQMLLNMRTPVSSSDRGSYLRLDLPSLEKSFGATRLKARLAQIKAGSEEALRDMVAMVDEAIELNNP